MSEWISVEKKLPQQFQDVLVSDHERQWVASCYKSVWIASHPDYKREEWNAYGCPYTVRAAPTHWMPLPKPPKE